MTPPNSANSTGSAELSRGALLVVFLGLLIAMFMFSLNQTVLATALPTIVGELDGWNTMLWVSTAFMLASTVTMPIYGKIGDLFGRKPMLLVAIALFMVGSIIGMLAHTMTLLIVGRIFQGLGGGGLLTLSQAIIASIVPARERGKYMGIMGGAFALSSVAGPLIGGWLTEGPGWRWTFAINLPLGATALIICATLFTVPHTKRAQRPPIDVWGMVLIALFTTSLILMSAWGGHSYEWTDPVILGLIAVAAVSAVVFVVVEAKVAEPIIPMSLFADRNFTLATLAGIFIGVALFGVLSYMPTYLQMVYGLEATEAGLLMTPMMGALLVCSTLVGFIVSRFGRYKAYPIVGVLIMAVSLVLLSLTDPDASPAYAIAVLTLMGVGIGISMQLLVLVVQNSFPVAMVGTATSSNNFFRQIGGTLGMSVIGSLFTQRLMDHLKGAHLPPSVHGGLTPPRVAALPEPAHSSIVHAYSDALVPIFLWVAPLLVIAAAILLFIIETPLATRVSEQGRAQRETLADTPDAAEPSTRDAGTREVTPS